MGRLSKSFALIFILIMAISSASLLTIKPANAQIPTATQQGVPVPNVPSSVTLSLTGPPYVQPTTYQLDPSTGKIVAEVGYSNEYGYLVITIKNQPNNYSPYSVYYNVREGNASENSWSYPLTPNFDMYQLLPTQSTDSGYTNISLPIDTEIGSNYTLEFEVQAMVGSIVHNTYEGLNAGWIFSGQTSDWSSPQTTTIPASIPLSPTPAPSSSGSTPTTTPTSTSVSSAPSSSSLLLITTVALIVIAFLLAVIIALLLYMRKRNRLLESNLKGLT
jgi:hypothetical protein